MSKPLSSRSHSSKLIKPQEGVVGTSDLLSYQTGALGHLWQTGTWGTSERACGAEPLVSGIWPCLQVQSVGIDLNRRTPSWCRENWLVWESLPCIWSPEESAGKCFAWGIRKRDPGREELGSSPFRERLNWGFSLHRHANKRHLTWCGSATKPQCCDGAVFAGSVRRHSKKPGWRLSEGVPNPLPSAEMPRGGWAPRTAGGGASKPAMGKRKSARGWGDTSHYCWTTNTRQFGPDTYEGPRLSAYTCVFYLTGSGSPWRIPSAEVTQQRGASGRWLCSSAGWGAGGLLPGRGVSVQRCFRGKAAGGEQGRAWGLGPGRKSWWGQPGQAPELLEGGRGRRLQRDFQPADTPADEWRRHYTELVSLLPGNKRRSQSLIISFRS